MGKLGDDLRELLHINRKHDTAGGESGAAFGLKGKLKRIGLSPSDAKEVAEVIKDNQADQVIRDFQKSLDKIPKGSVQSGTSIANYDGDEKGGISALDVKGLAASLQKE